MTPDKVSAKLPIKERIRLAMGNQREIGYHALARKVFPEEDFPRAWRYSSNGGPPGCFMALSRAIDRHGYVSIWRGRDRFVALRGEARR